MRWPHPPRRTTIIIIVVIGIIVFAYKKIHKLESRFQYTLPFQISKGRPDQSDSRAALHCPSEVEHLRRHDYGLTREIMYQKRCIRPSIDENIDRTAVSELADSLVGEGRLLQLDGTCDGWEAPQCEEVAITVPPAYPKQKYSHLFFGVATSYDRLNVSMSQFEIWLANSGAQLLAIVTDAEDRHGEFSSLSLQFREHGIELIMVKPWDKSLGPNEQHFTVLRDLLWHSTPETKWVGIIDDDTFFPSLYPLSQTLEKYDHTKNAYLGALSENFDQVKHHGFMAFGGAGIFLSMPLVRKLEPHIEQCLNEYGVPQGDGLLKYCIYSKTKAKLSMIPGLHQLDMNGDMGGFYESRGLPLSLHHWKSWHKAPVDMMGKVLEFCGGCFLQRFRFGSDTVLTNGYSIAMYQGGTGNLDFDRIEGT
ncbi:Fc.00g095110.m01.CDS01 [Cosmosporella sp. VM-42]